MKKILLVLSRMPWPVDTGQKGLISYWCELLNDRLGLKVYLYITNQGNIDESKIPNFIFDFKIGPKVSSKSKMINLINLSLLKGAPLQCSLYFDKKNVKSLVDYYNDVKPDYVLFDMIRLMYYSKYLVGCKKIMYLGDLLSNRYDLQLKSKTADDIFGQSNEQSFFRKLARNRFFRGLALRIEKRKVYKAELKCVNMFDKVVFISAKEANEYDNRTKKTKAYVVPIGVDFDYFSKCENDVNNNNLVFLGNYNYGPNYSSVEMICNEVLPLLKVDFKMFFIGNVPSDLKEKYESKNIYFLGRVDDTREQIGKSAIFLAPIAYGTGVKTKIIEAMAMGKCIITNSIGAENIDAEAGKDIIIEDDFSQIASIIGSLFSNRNKILEIGCNAKDIARKYAYNQVEKAISNLIEQ